MANPVFGYRPIKNRNKIPTGTPVNVIANFNSSGEFIPLFFQVNDDNGEKLSYKICSISSMKDKHSLRIFVCNFIANEDKQTIILQYEFDSKRWTVG